MRTDEQIIDFILSQHETHDEAARALHVTNRQTLYNWRERGIPPGWRHALWLWCRRHGLKLSADWLIKSLVAHESHNPMTTNGGGNGRARKGQSRQQARRQAKDQRQRRSRKRSAAHRAQQRRAGRGLPTLAAQD
jgi:hypothetical protein